MQIHPVSQPLAQMLRAGFGLLDGFELTDPQNLLVLRVGTKLLQPVFVPIMISSPAWLDDREKLNFLPSFLAATSLPGCELPVLAGLLASPSGSGSVSSDRYLASQFGDAVSADAGIVDCCVEQGCYALPQSATSEAPVMTLVFVLR